MKDPGPQPTQQEFEGLRSYLLGQTRKCVRPPVDRFRHPWIAPMPLSTGTREYLRSREQPAIAGSPQPHMAQAASGDGIKSGDYSLGLFHHDASEASIELFRHPEFHDVAAGSLLCLLDGASPDGRVHRTELPHKSREAEPAKPVIAQFAWRAVSALGPAGLEWAQRHRVLERVRAFVGFLERHYTGLHGLFLTPSSLASGFDSDLLTAGLPDKSVEGPDTNAFMVLEYEALASLARSLGNPTLAASALEKAAELRDRMEKLLWREEARGGFYLALRWQHGVGSLEGEVVSSPGPGGSNQPVQSWTTLLPLYAGVPSAARAEKLIERLVDPAGYWGPWGVRTAPADDVYFHQAPRVMMFDFKKNGRGPVSNWNGPVWILSNYYLAVGLARYGHLDKARELALKTARLLTHNLETRGMLSESYDDRGNGLWPREGTFISWNVLALTLLDQFVFA